VWGVGTKLVTGYDQPALGGVFKLSALRAQDGSWQPKLKVSDEAAKVTNPGVLQVRRFRSEQRFNGDAIYDSSRPVPERFTIVDPSEAMRRKQFAPDLAWEDLLVPVFRQGRLVYASPAIHEIRERAQRQLAMLHPSHKRLIHPHRYPAGLELGLHKLKTRLILKAREET
jgi:nicotinate phosphoribosyltransferase